MVSPIRIGTRDSRLAVWQATEVQQQLDRHGISSELVFIKSEGDLDLTTPLYEIGVQGIFTRSLDMALLANRIDIAVHSMKDVPTQLPAGIVQAAVLPRGPVKDLLVYRNDRQFVDNAQSVASVATSSIRRRAQWLHRYPLHHMENLRGNMQTRLHKLTDENWDAAIFAQAGLERIGLRPDRSIELDWMLPAPAQGAIMVVARGGDRQSLDICLPLNDRHTAICTQVERSFLRGLLGGCSTPVSALATTDGQTIQFRGNIFSPDGSRKVEITREAPVDDYKTLGADCAAEVLQRGGTEINRLIREQLKPERR